MSRYANWTPAVASAEAPRELGSKGLVFIRSNKKRAYVLVIRTAELQVVRLPDMDFHQQDTD